MENNDKRIKEFFDAARKEIPADGFPERVTGRLPRRGILPWVVIAVFYCLGAVFGLILCGDLLPVAREMFDGGLSVDYVFTYIVLMLVAGSSAYTFYKVEKI